MDVDKDLDRFLTLMTGISDYYGKTLSEGVQQLYWQGLRQYDIGVVEKALWEHTQSPDSGQFMPKIADVTRLMQGRTQDQASIAWSKVDAAVRGIGTYVDVVFDDALIHRVIAEMGGWIFFGTQKEGEWPFVAKRFETIYRAYRMRNELPDYPPLLTGIANAQNAVEGFAKQTPTLIGDVNKAKLVLKGGSDKPLLQMHRASELTGVPALRLVGQ